MCISLFKKCLQSENFKHLPKAALQTLRAAILLQIAETDSIKFHWIEIEHPIGHVSQQKCDF